MEERKAAESTAGPRAFGFLTAVESPSHGIFGGYLLVDPWGRPLEFHCTAPVKVSRAQQILFGATLPAHLHGQQIGGTLLAEGAVEPAVVLTDLEPMLHVRRHTSLPVALVRAGHAVSAPDDADIALGAVTVSPPAGDAARHAALREKLEELAATVDLREPFERIRAAIEEAQRH
jgi:hypothetical protein